MLVGLLDFLGLQLLEFFELSSVPVVGVVLVVEVGVVLVGVVGVVDVVGLMPVVVEGQFAAFFALYGDSVSGIVWGTS